MKLTNPKNTEICFVNGRWELIGEKAPLWKRGISQNPLFCNWQLGDCKGISLTVAYSPYGEDCNNPNAPGTLDVHWAIGGLPGHISSVHLTSTDCKDIQDAVQRIQEFLMSVPICCLLPQNNQIAD